MAVFNTGCEHSENSFLKYLTLSWSGMHISNLGAQKRFAEYQDSQVPQNGIWKTKKEKTQAELYVFLSCCQKDCHLQLTIWNCFGEYKPKSNSLSL